MANRHRMRPGDWESVFGRLEELVLANSGEDEFEEIYKLLIAKLFDELRPSDGEAEFRCLATPAATTQAINRLLAHAAARWNGIVEGQPRSRLSDEHLTICVEALESYSLLDTNLEILDGAFEYLVSKASKGAKGQYFTPRHIVDFCIRALAPRSGESIVDPACGSGGFLIHALNFEAPHDAQAGARITGENVWGFDFDRRSIQVARALMLIAGYGQANLYRLNSLMTPDANLSPLAVAAGDGTVPRMTIEDVLRSRTRRHEGFDVLLTNPPFAGEIRERQILDSYDLSRGRTAIERDVLFLERCVQLLKPSGRMAIVLPHNKFASPVWSYAREWLLRRLQVVSVVGLGRNTFMPHTSQKTSVLLGVKRERVLRSAPTNEEVLFLISEKDGKDSRGRVVPRDGSSPEDPAWTRADHDLDTSAEVIRDFVAKLGIPWGAS